MSAFLTATDVKSFKEFLAEVVTATNAHEFIASAPRGSEDPIARGMRTAADTTAAYMRVSANVADSAKAAYIDFLTETIESGMVLATTIAQSGGDNTLRGAVRAIFEATDGTKLFAPEDVSRLITFLIETVPVLNAHGAGISHSVVSALINAKDGGEFGVKKVVRTANEIVSDAGKKKRLTPELAKSIGEVLSNGGPPSQLMGIYTNRDKNDFGVGGMRELQGGLTLMVIVASPNVAEGVKHRISGMVDMDFTQDPESLIRRYGDGVQGM